MEDARGVEIKEGDAIVWTQHSRYRPTLAIRAGYIARLTEHRVVAVNEDGKDERYVDPLLVVVVNGGLIYFDKVGE